MFEIEWIIERLYASVVDSYKGGEYHLAHRLLNMLVAWQGHNPFLRECQFLCALQHQNKPWSWRLWKPRHDHEPFLPRDFEEFFDRGWLDLINTLDSAPNDGAIYRWTSAGNVLKLVEEPGSMDTGTE